ncbi:MULTISPECIES: hypothetical protein [Novilysobacter]|uniref:hypothetical protein n=1 Tax=Novilysobacter TaxID=3382699 RepID=UPI002ED7B771
MKKKAGAIRPFLLQPGFRDHLLLAAAAQDSAAPFSHVWGTPGDHDPAQTSRLRS